MDVYVVTYDMFDSDQTDPVTIVYGVFSSKALADAAVANVKAKFAADDDFTAAYVDHCHMDQEPD